MSGFVSKYFQINFTRAYHVEGFDGFDMRDFLDAAQSLTATAILDRWTTQAGEVGFTLSAIVPGYEDLAVRLSGRFTDDAPVLDALDGCITGLSASYQGEPVVGFGFDRAPVVVHAGHEPQFAQRFLSMGHYWSESEAPGRAFWGSVAADRILGEGQIHGGRGSDLLYLQPAAPGTIADRPVSRAFGEGAGDYLQGDLEAARLFGGDGADVLLATRGRTVMHGGRDADQFGLDSAEAEDGTRVIVADFDPQADHLHFRAEAFRGQDFGSYDWPESPPASSMLGPQTLAEAPAIAGNGLRLLAWEQNGDAILRVALPDRDARLVMVVRDTPLDAILLDNLYLL